MLIKAPFSDLKIDSTQVLNLLTFSLAASAYLYAHTIFIKDTHFINNNYDPLTQVLGSSYQGGYLDIQSNNLEVISTEFKNSIAEKGSAVSITPSNSGASYKFTSCTFDTLLAATYGAAVYIPEAMNSTSLTLDSCTFSGIASNSGGAVYVYYAVKSLVPSEFFGVFPNITVKAANSAHIYASQGGLVYAENSNVTLLNIISAENDPAHVTSASINLKSYLTTIQILGPYV